MITLTAEIRLDSVQAAVESKQVAQQNAQRAALIVEKAKQERQQKIVEAEGEAQSALLIGKASAI